MLEKFQNMRELNHNMGLVFGVNTLYNRTYRKHLDDLTIVYDYDRQLLKTAVQL
jgi:hypothetical protein